MIHFLYILPVEVNHLFWYDVTDPKSESLKGGVLNDEYEANDNFSPGRVG